MDRWSRKTTPEEAPEQLDGDAEFLRELLATFREDGIVA